MSSPAVVWETARGTPAQTAKHSKTSDRTRFDNRVFIIPRNDRRWSVRSKPLLGTRALAKPRSTCGSRGSNNGRHHHSDHRQRQSSDLPFLRAIEISFLTQRSLGRIASHRWLWEQVHPYSWWCQGAIAWDRAWSSRD